MVKKTKKEKEKGILDAFINIKPDFAGESVTCEQCKKDPPDFICENNKRIMGVELGEWLHKDQTTRSRAFEDIEKIIKEEGLSCEVKDFLKNHSVSIFPISEKSPNKPDRARFISELNDLLTEFIKTSKSRKEEYWLNDFSRYPKLKKYITGIGIYVTMVPLGIEFVRGGAYSPDDVVDALLKIINDKINKNNYQNLKNELGLSELHLIIYYNMALIYNAPFAGVEQEIHSIVESVKKELAKNHGPFDKIFLFIALEPGKEVFTLYP
jgi:hypothetical protein